jgi:catechol 2,3-dioxygenase-like lactoylglutathione lyase family enzyme
MLIASTLAAEASMAKLKLDHCVIHVSDWTRSNAFYRDVMGAEVVARGNGWVYRFGDMQLNLPRARA